MSASGIGVVVDGFVLGEPALFVEGILRVPVEAEARCMVALCFTSE